jgi:hypothetical protein
LLVAAVVVTGVQVVAAVVGIGRFLGNHFRLRQVTALPLARVVLVRLVALLERRDQQDQTLYFHRSHQMAAAAGVVSLLGLD